MRSSIPAAIAAALGASGAHAQPLEAWTWMAEVEHPVIDPSKGITTQTVTVSAHMDAEAPYVAIAGTVFDTLGDADAHNGHITGWQVLNGLDYLTGDLTTTDGVSLFNTNAGQLCSAGYCPQIDDNPVDVLQFTWELDDPGAYDVTYTTDTEAAVAWIGADPEVAEAFEAKIINEGQFGWTVVPAPAAAWPVALLALRPRRRGGPPGTRSRQD